MSRTYDVAVLGATPAGYVAANVLAENRRNVVLLDAPSSPVECPLADWVGRGFFKLGLLPKSLLRTCQAEAFRDVHYHNVALDKEVCHRSRATVGYSLPAAALLKALRAGARKSGVSLRSTRTNPAISLEEDIVRLLGTARIRARLLLIAQDSPSEAIGQLALPVRTVPRSSLVAAALDVPLTSRALTKPFGTEMHVVESRQRGELGLFFMADRALHIRLISRSSAAAAQVTGLSAMVAELQRGGLLPADLPLSRARGAVWHPPGGVALELETHVAKRCLLIGTAGGFVETITGQTLTASVRSALLAADVCHAALNSNDPQDALMRFKTSWRKSLADFIRPPNTSLHMLLPLLFVNRRMVGRFTGALLQGENI